MMEIVVAFILISVISSVLAARYAQKKGRDFWTIFFISLTITPLFLLASHVVPFKIKKSILFKE
jgi:hypothetical protein